MNAPSLNSDPLRRTDAVPANMPRAPAAALPPDACDTHSHVFGPYSRFAFSMAPSYPPPLAPFESYLTMLETVGARRGVLVQPAPYGTDNTALADALVRGEGRIRGVAVLAPDADDATLSALERSGVRALRFNEMPSPQTGKPYAGSVGIDAALSLASRMRDIGWHAQVWARCADVPSIADKLASVGLPVVFEHMGSLDPALGTGHRDFQNLLALLREGRIAVKLAVCRVSKQAPHYADLRPFHDRMIEANPRQLVWASDWPHVRMGDAAPDVGALLDTFTDWVDDAAIRNAILVDNPARLYGFGC
ncbi:amidohydrolase family protein [Paraburkholderia dilworthii]|uniref:amidohydrolase family protein n=1 Tax=Paraburkholderia dilworthii TaxID=948106 RepID=UPI0004053E99|nr:amidohydrolase family protein [Paraburkholderia dilworthii]